MHTGNLSHKVLKSQAPYQQGHSNKKKSLLQKIALLISPFFIFVARRFYPIGLKRSCTLALIGSSLIYLFQKVFSGKNRKTQKMLEQSNRVDRRKKEGQEELDRTELIQVLNRRKENDPKKRDQNLRGTAFEIWLLRNYGELLKEFGIRDCVSIPKAIEGLEERGKDIGDERFDLVTKLEKKIISNVYLLFGDDDEALLLLLKDAKILIAILETEKDDLIDARHALTLLEDSFQNCKIDVDAFAIFLSFLKRSREAGKTEEQMNQAALKVLKDKREPLDWNVMIFREGMKDFCRAMQREMEMPFNEKRAF